GALRVELGDRAAGHAVVGGHGLGAITVDPAHRPRAPTAPRARTKSMPAVGALWPGGRLWDVGVAARRLHRAGACGLAPVAVAEHHVRRPAPRWRLTGADRLRVATGVVEARVLAVLRPGPALGPRLDGRADPAAVDV